uniref:Odorant binding protein n=1 Tax=Glyphodes pyloalis TaxID=1242752 RepID=A0A6M3GVH9_GLYPY|nr:odorant binding protein [Glyphodes pyloalis]
MNHLTVFSLVMLCVGHLSAEKPTVHLVPEKMGDLMQSLMSCLLEAPVDPEVLLQLRNGGSPKNIDEKGLQKFAYCAFIKSGYGKKNGHVKVDKALELYPKNVDKEQIKKVMEECNGEEGKEPAETAFKFMKCFREKSPVRAIL